jgi:hypothetical protein
MPRKCFDPLTFIPSPEAIQRHLEETESLAVRLRILLQVAQDIRTAIPPIKRGHQSPEVSRAI